MKKIIFYFLIISIVIFFHSQCNAQVTNLTVNGATPGQHFTMESGGEMNWQYNVPLPGDTAFIEIWLDLNNSGIIDSSVDKIWQRFYQIDGDTVGDNGPPDLDGIANGSVFLNILLGLAPADYILKVENNGIGQAVAGTVTPLTDVAYTISGKVTVPAGIDPSNISVELNRSDEFMPFFWDALTDAQGNFAIRMTSDTTGNPWELELLEGQFDGFLINPKNYEITIDGDKNNLDFSVTEADAQVSGKIEDETGNAIPFQTVTLFYLLSDNSGSFNYYSNSDINGLFHFGIPENMLTGQEWILQTWSRNSDTTENFMDTRIKLNPINVGDSVYKNLTLYFADTTITGTVSFEGIDTNIPRTLIIAATDSTEAYANNDTATGKYTLRVSSKMSSYKLFGTNLPPDYDPITLQNILPGEINADFNYILTDVKKNDELLPKQFKLFQNYPNPFNPTTTIEYSIPYVETRHTLSVQLRIYDILGRQVASLLNKSMNPGNYEVHFNASDLPSGLYFYRLTAGKYIAVKKMMLLK